MAASQPGDFIAQGSTTQKEIAITFDDGPGPLTPKFLDLLDKYDVKATFFMLGEQIKRWPEEAKEVVKRGQEIGNHTFKHTNYLHIWNEYRESVPLEADKKVIQDLIEDMKRTQATILDHTGQKPVLCRMPHGVDRPWVNTAAREAGLILVNWSFGADWVKKPIEELKEDYLEAIRPGAILLFHDGGSGREKSLVLVEAILEEAKKRSFKVVPLQDWIR